MTTGGRPRPQRPQEPAVTPAGHTRLQPRPEQAGAGRPDPRAARRRATPTPPRQLRLLTWGLVPSWAKDPKIGRADDQRPRRVGRWRSRRSPRRRHAVGASCPPRAGTSRRSRRPPPTPRATRSSSRSSPRGPTASPARSPGSTSSGATRPSPTRDDPAAWLTTFTIITTEAEPGLDRIHDRQPLVLDRDDWADLARPRGDRHRPRSPRCSAEGAGPLRRHTPSRRAVSSNRTNGPQLIEPVDPANLRGVVDPMTGEIIGAARRDTATARRGRRHRSVLPRPTSSGRRARGGRSS